MSGVPIFIGGAGRSGTTLVRVILDSHPHIACGPELKVTPSLCRMWHEFQTALAGPLREYGVSAADVNGLFADLIAGLLAKQGTRTGKVRVAEKSPNNVFYFEHLNRLFPESPLVHVIRDGRDVVASLLKMDWIDPRTRRPLEYTRDPGKAAAYWVRAVRTGRAAGRVPAVAPRYFEVRYEDMVRETAATLEKLFAFIGEPWDPVVLRFHEQKRNLAGESSAGQVSQGVYDQAIGRWQRELNDTARQAVKETAGDLLIELGYAEDRNW